MKQAIIHVHGGDSFSEQSDFISYLKTVPLRDLPGSVPYVSWKQSLVADLGSEYVVYLPSMPNRTNARYEEWKIWFLRYLELAGADVILIGHSLGGMFLAKYLSEETAPVPIKALFLIAAPSGEYKGDPKYGDCMDFTFKPELAKNITKQVPQVMIWHSEDDHVVPVAELEWYKKYVPGSKITVFQDKNHFLGPAFPELVTALKSLSV
jgi:uncharacterized protein